MVLLDRYWEKHAQKLASAERAKIALAKWRDWWAGKTVADLTLDNQRAFVEHLQRKPLERGSRSEKMSSGSVARDFGVGKAAIAWAYKNQEIKSHPYVMAIASESTRDRTLTIEESARILNASAASEHTWRYALLAFATAARPGAILGITTSREQIDLDRYRLNLLPPGEAQKPKKRKPILPMPTAIIPWLRLWMRPEALVYRATRKGRSKVRLEHLITFHGKRLARARETFDLIKQRAEFDDPTVTAYTIRHTMATWMAEREVPDREREMWLGHRGPGSKTTARYTHLKPDYLRNAAAAVDAYFTAVAPLVTTKSIKVLAMVSASQEKA